MRNEKAHTSSAGTIRSLLSLIPLACLGSLRAAELIASDGQGTDESISADQLGTGVGLSGNVAIIGAPNHNLSGANNVGAAYLFLNLESITGTASESSKITASRQGTNYVFGNSVSVDGGIAVIGAPGEDFFQDSQGAAYVVQAATGSQTARLTATPRFRNARFGASVSISGNTALIGASRDNDGLTTNVGSAHVFQGLGSISGSNVTQDARLQSSDRAEFDYFGTSVSLSGDIGIVGAFGKSDRRGAVYVFRGLGSASGSLTEDAKLIASDAVSEQRLSISLSVSGTNCLIGADGAGGGAYFYKNLNSVTGTHTESYKLAPSDAASAAYFGAPVALSGDKGLVGGDFSVYLFCGLDTASTSPSETIKITVSEGSIPFSVDDSLAFEGDRFLIGCSGGNGVATGSGTAFFGTVSSMTTLDAGNGSHFISGLGFESRTDWIIGESTGGNTVTLGSGDRATVKTPDSAVYIGKESGADNNRLQIEGTIDTDDIYVGSLDGNTGNTLALGTDATVLGTPCIRVAPGNSLEIPGEIVSFSDLSTSLGGGILKVHDGSQWVAVSGSNFSEFELDFDSGSGGTTISLPGGGGGTPGASFRITEVLVSDNEVSLTWRSTQGATYNIEYSTDLAGGGWNDVDGSTNIPAAAGSSTTEVFTSPVEQPSPAFFRVMRLAP